MERQHKTYNFIGQSTAEYAVLLAIVAAALISMQMYIKRGIQGRIKDLADQISPPDKHYEQNRTESNYTTEQYGKTIQTFTGGKTETTTPVEWFDDKSQKHKGEETKRWGNETVYPEVQETEE